MADTPIRFDNGATYEKYMGAWSQQVGHQFLDWLAPAAQQPWADIGCGNGAFTQLLLERCQPVSVHGVDPSAEQIAFAQSRFSTGLASFAQGDAMALPLADQSVGQVVMALVIFFVPQPARGLAEMARVLQPGGTASAYAWDILGGGFPWVAMQNALSEVGLTPNFPPSVVAANLDALRQLWSDAGLVDVQTHTLTVQRTFPDFEAYWQTGILGPSLVTRIGDLGPAKLEVFKDAVRQQLGGGEGAITVSARANAVKGRKPGAPLHHAA